MGHRRSSPAERNTNRDRRLRQHRPDPLVQPGPLYLDIGTTDIILRNPDGNTWLINTAGEIQTIPDGGTYLCLATTNPVIWNVPEPAIDNWPPSGNEPAACGRAGGLLP